MGQGKHAPVYVYFDGDDVGASIELKLLRNDADGAAQVSSAVSAATASLSEHVRTDLNGTIIFAAGDDVFAELPRVPLEPELEALRVRFFSECGLSLSCGVGATVKSALFYLRIAKLSGKNRTAGISDG